jgi:hypothetical protein
LKRRLQRIAATFNARARKEHIPGVVAWQHLAIAGERCAYCGVHLELDQGTWDHRVPFHSGGDNWPTNIVRCCYSCNRRKFTKSEIDFLTYDNQVTCARPGCGVVFTARFAERKRGMAKFCSHRCSGMAKGKNW